MNLIPIQNLDDSRLADYAGVRERQLAREFTDLAAPESSPAAHAPHGKFLAEGEIVFSQLVRSPYRTLSVLCTPLRVETIREQLALLDPAVPIYLLPQERMDHLIGFPLHRGLMAVAARNSPLEAASLLARPGPGIILILENLANHDNIGSLFRNAAAFGAHSLLLSPSCSDPLYRKAIRVSVGHALTTPYARLDSWPASLAQVKQAGYELLALTPKSPSVALRDFRPRASPSAPARLALMVGAEGPGLTDAAIAAADCAVRIPMSDGVDSLNVSVAAAIALEHLRHLVGSADRPE